jgi:hypothetical protein
MRFIRLAISAAIIAGVVAAVVDAASTLLKDREQAALRARQALYQSCRQQAFRALGEQNGSPETSADVVIQQMERCVKNGGRL